MSNGTVADIYELSPLQQGMLLHSLHDGAADMYLSQQTYAVDGPLDADALIGAWQAVVAAHPVLRTSFHWAGLEKPLQVVHQDVGLPVHRHDWSDADNDAQHKRLDDLYAQDRAAGFDPEVPPLQRLHLIRLGHQRHWLVWTYHHILLDGWSVPVFLDGVMAWYRTVTTGTPPPPAVPAYRDYIGWLQRQDRSAPRDFWTTTLAGTRPTHVAQLPATDPTHGTGDVQRRTVGLPAALTDALRQAAARHQVTFSTMVQAVWAAVVQSYTGQSEITFGCATSGRPAELPHVERMVGLFANTLPLRVSMPADEDLGSWLRDIQNGYAQMRRYEYTPLSDIKKWAELPGRQLFDSLLVLENYSLAIDTGTPEVPGADPLTFRVDKLYDKIDLPLTLTVAPGPVSEMQLLIHRDRFRPDFVDDLLARLHHTLEVITTAGRTSEVLSPAVPEPEPRPGPAVAPAPPAGPDEEAIAAAYGEVLELAAVDATTSFFDLGGDSFAAVRAVSRIPGATVGLLAANPSVRELARALDTDAAEEPDGDLDREIAELEDRLARKRAAKEQERQTTADQVRPVPRADTMICTHQQETLWSLHQENPASPVYHIPFVLRLHGALDVPALERAVRTLIVRHEALRTRFTERDGIPRQVVDPAPEEYRLPIAELRPEEVGEWAPHEAHRPLDLTAGPLFRVSLARVAPEEHVIVVVVHHIVADGWSLHVLSDELMLNYAAQTGRPELPLPPAQLQAADHAAWQRDRLGSTDMRRQLDYWRQTLADLPTIDFPTDRPRPASPTTAGTPMARRVPDELTMAVRAYARTWQGSLLAVTHAALLTVLHRYTGQEDLPIGSTFNGRVRPELEPVVGYLANNVVLRTGVAGEPSFAELVSRCHATILAAAAHQDVPFDLVVDALRPERVPGRHPLFQISLTLQPAATKAALTLGSLVAEPVRIAGGHSRYDVAVDVFDNGDHLVLKVEYSTELFDADRIERLLDHLFAVLAQGVATPGTPVGDVDLAPATAVG
ncbi:MAG TPA: condensation domain-containing protein [Actinoplanes sp.]